eukprot:4263288-Prymnesium_polylepis.1
MKRVERECEPPCVQAAIPVGAVGSWLDGCRRVGLRVPAAWRHSRPGSHKHNALTCCSSCRVGVRTLAP